MHFLHVSQACLEYNAPKNPGGWSAEPGTSFSPVFSLVLVSPINMIISQSELESGIHFPLCLLACLVVFVLLKTED